MQLTTWALLFGASVGSLLQNPAGPVGSSQPLPPGGPQPAPAYMVDNINNEYHVAPDKGVLNGPVTGPLDASTLAAIHKNDPSLVSPNNTTMPVRSSRHPVKSTKRANTDDYWLSTITHGEMPLAPAGYKFYRNVRDYGARGDGSTDDTAAINRAITDGKRCGSDCGSSTTTGALVYFPPGTYIVSSPLVQYYYTQFVGNPDDRPTIKGSANFSGIALVDNDVYIPGGGGAEWYINQSNFYRQIRNMIFDLTAMKNTNFQGDQQYAPTGIHWQVGQATSITNCHFEMPISTSTSPASAVGILMENGSGGFMSDLTFNGGNIGFRAGSQQFTARNLSFKNCLTAISQIWDWGFTWQNIYVESCYAAINCTLHSGATGQGTGSISVLDSHFNNVQNAIPLSSDGVEPNIVLDNLLIENTPKVVAVDGGKIILPGSSGAVTITQWAMGLQYKNNDGSGAFATGLLQPQPTKPAGLLSSGRYYTRSKPQYEGVAVGDIVVATDHGVSNAFKGDQTGAINSLLASNVGKVIFFPAGIYLVSNTVRVPLGSKIIGEGWPQIMATGPNFQDATKPRAMVQVGNPGDRGVIEITDMLFTVQGPTAGCILVEWNVHESTQGSAGMWDSHFRVGGAAGSDLQTAQCPTGSSTPNPKCQAASLLLHVTSKASGYFENVWAWVADHDLDNPNNAKISEGQDGVPNDVTTNIDVYAARGVLVESKGPSWFWGTASEHSQFYQYQLAGAENVYLGHMQTESPYYQPKPNATQPFHASDLFPQDPLFLDCAEAFCAEAWALRVLNSKNVFIYSAGFYSFFGAHELGCVGRRDCQERLVETNYASGLWLYNLFTVGNTQIISPQGGLEPVFFNDTTQHGYTSEIAAWLPLALQGDNIGTNLNSTSGGSGIVYIDPTIWNLPTASRTVQCFPPCTLVFPAETLSTTTTISFPPYTTSLEVGWYTTAVEEGTTSTYYTSITETTVLTIPAYTGTTIDVWNTVITSGVKTTDILITTSILPPPFPVTNNPNPLSQSGVSHSPVTRNVTLPPWPYTEPTATKTSTNGGGGPVITFRGGPPNPTCLGGCGSPCKIFCSHPCLLCPPGGGGGLGGGDGGFNDPSDPNNPSRTSSQCTTKTYSSCATQCTASPSGCKSTCSSVVGCDTTGTQVASTITPAPVVTSFGETWGVGVPNTAAELSAALSEYSVLSSLGDYSSSSLTTQPPTTTRTTSTAYPTNTDENTGDAYCYSSSNGPYVQFTQADAQVAVTSFCQSNYVLGPGNAFGYVEAYTHGYTVYVTGKWAPDQTGCGSEQNFAFNKNIGCSEGWATDFFCGNQDGGQTTSFGGGYVLKLPGNVGCILLELYAENGGSKERRGLSSSPSVNSTTGPSASNSSNWHMNMTSSWPVDHRGSDPHRAQLFNPAALAKLMNATTAAKATGDLHRLPERDSFAKIGSV